MKWLNQEINNLTDDQLLKGAATLNVMLQNYNTKLDKNKVRKVKHNITAGETFLQLQNEMIAEIGKRGIK